MKKQIMTTALALLAIAISTTGCLGPYFRSQNQYEKGKWHGLADHEQASQISQQRLNLERQRMALEKLQAQPVMVGVRTSTGVVATVVAPGTTMPADSVGYKGIVANLSQNRRYNFRIQGPESKAFYLGPGQRAPDEACYLLPGRYVATISYNGYKTGQPHIFDVGVQEKFFMSEKCHWYLVAEW